MELRIATPEQLTAVYESDLKKSFPPAELKSLREIQEMWKKECYRPWCLFDGGTIVGECFLWLGKPGWALLDYLCVSPGCRNSGTGSLIIQKLLEAEAGTVIFGESEIPAYAPDPAMAERRLGFYARNGAKTAGYDTAMFGVPYKTLYWADAQIPDEELMEHHQSIYQGCFSPRRYAKFVQIPFDPQRPQQLTPWSEEE